MIRSGSAAATASMLSCSPAGNSLVPCAFAASAQAGGNPPSRFVTPRTRVSVATTGASRAYRYPARPPLRTTMRSADAGTVTEPFSVSITRVVGSAALVGSSFESLLQPIIATSATISNPAMATNRRQLRIARGGVDFIIELPLCFNCVVFELCGRAFRQMAVEQRGDRRPTRLGVTNPAWSYGRWCTAMSRSPRTLRQRSASSCPDASASAVIRVTGPS